MLIHEAARSKEGDQKRFRKAESESEHGVAGLVFVCPSYERGCEDERTAEDHSSQTEAPADEDPQG